MLSFAVAALTACGLGAAAPPVLPDTDVARSPVTTATGPRPIVRFPVPLAVDTPAPRPRPQAIEHSDAYYTRLKIHRWVGFTVYPLAVGEYFVGQKLYNNPSQGTKSTHLLLATGLAGAFGLNTITGVWNLYESREDPGKARRYLHTILMLASDAGFVATAATAPHHEGFDDGFGGFGGFERSGGGNRATHRALAFGSMGVGVASGLMMLVWR